MENVTSTVVSSPRLLRQADALQLLEGITDVRRKRAVRLFYRQVVRRFERRTCLPSGDFDLLYFIEGIVRFCSGHTAQAIFEGADIRWFPEFDERNVTSCPLPDRPPGEFVDPSNGWTWLARSHEAHWFTATIKDLALHQLVQVGKTAIEKGPVPLSSHEDELPTSTRRPDAPIDMLFCAEVIFDICHLKQRVARGLGSPSLEMEPDRIVGAD
jgi:hypothetical protein